MKLLEKALKKILCIVIKKEGDSAFVEIIKKEELLPDEKKEVEKMIEGFLDGEVQKDDKGNNLKK